MSEITSYHNTKDFRDFFCIVMSTFKHSTNGMDNKLIENPNSEYNDRRRKIYIAFSFGVLQCLSLNKFLSLGGDSNNRDHMNKVIMNDINFFWKWWIEPGLYLLEIDIPRDDIKRAMDREASYAGKIYEWWVENYSKSPNREVTNIVKSSFAATQGLFKVTNSKPYIDSKSEIYPLEQTEVHLDTLHRFFCDSELIL